MKVTIIQKDIVWANPAANIAKTEVVLNKYADTNLFILPEMWNTGFSLDAGKIAESTEGETLHWMQRKAFQKNCAICGSIAVKDNGKYYNRFYFVKPNGLAMYYDKHHLFTIGGEDKIYAAGDGRVVVMYKGVRILLLTCYDLRFPVWSRNNDDFDMIIYVGSWTTIRIDAWKALLKARAIENQSYVAGVNRVGMDADGYEYCGASVVHDPYGKVIASCEENKECEANAIIDMEVLKAFRKNFPVLQDRDPLPYIESKSSKRYKNE